MKNKALKNLISIGALAILILGANVVSAEIYSYPSTLTIPQNGYNTNYSLPFYSSQNVYSPSYSGNSNSNYYNTTAYPNYNTSTTYPNYTTASSNSVQYNYLQQPAAQVQATQPQVIYVQQPVAQVQAAAKPQIIYVDRPATTVAQPTYTQTQPYTYVQPQVKYVEVPAAQTQYVTTGTQGASVIGTTGNTRVMTTAATNSGTASNTGQFVNYDANGQNMMLASAYGSYNQAQVVTPMAYDTNGVTALTVGGSGSFMPSSVFQWIILILIILGIVIIARMISKTFSKDHHVTTVH